MAQSVYTVAARSGIIAVYSSAHGAIDRARLHFVEHDPSFQFDVGLAVRAVKGSWLIQINGTREAVHVERFELER